MYNLPIWKSKTNISQNSEQFFHAKFLYVSKEKFLSWLCGALKYPKLFAQWNTSSSFWKVECKTKSFKRRHADTVYDENDDGNADLGDDGLVWWYSAVLYADTVYDENDDGNADLGDGGYTKPGLIRNLK